MVEVSHSFLNFVQFPYVVNLTSSVRCHKVLVVLRNVRIMFGNLLDAERMGTFGEFEMNVRPGAFTKSISFI